MAPSLTNNFLLLRTLSIRYPNPPIFYRMATPTILAAAPRNLGPVSKPLADSKGDEDVVLIRLFDPGPANSGGIRRHLTVCKTCPSLSLILRRNPATVFSVSKRLLSDSCFYFIR
jgi:hypothetical protein